MEKAEKIYIRDCLACLGSLLVSSDAKEDGEVLSLTYDTRELTPGGLFLCKGAHFRPEYAVTAAQKGALAYVSEKAYPEAPLPAILVTDIREAMARLALLFYRNAPSKITSVGITGTKGKSTTTYYVKAILDRYLEKECAVLSSIDNYDGVIREESHLTTPEILDLHRHFDNAVKSGLTHLVMEVSSQGLKVGRVAGVTFDVGVFHNIGTDHISPIEHPDFEDYFASKLKIFSHCRTACVNTDAQFAPRVLEEARKAGCRLLTYGTHEDDDIRGSQIEKREDGIYFTVRTPSYTKRMCITMPGMFNVSNALAACAVCEVLGIPSEFVADGLKVARAAGRMEVFSSEDKRVTVIVDYAHNRMSFEELFRSTDIEYPGRHKVAVFGCPGKKALLRRTDLGEISGRDCDRVIVTEEDSGEEPFSSIAADIEKAVLSMKHASCEVCEDRGEAIRRAVLTGEEPKVILLTGKGRETRMKRGLLYIDTPSDVDYTERYLREYDLVHRVPAGK